MIVGNVGPLRGNVRLLPDAVPDDGVLNVAVLTAWGWTGWLRLAADMLLRRRTSRVVHLVCRELIVDASRSRPWEVDGEVVGPTRQLRVTLQPGSLLLQRSRDGPRLTRRAAAWLGQRPCAALFGLRRSRTIRRSVSC